MINWSHIPVENYIVRRVRRLNESYWPGWPECLVHAQQHYIVNVSQTHRFSHLDLYYNTTSVIQNTNVSNAERIHITCSSGNIYICKDVRSTTSVNKTDTLVLTCLSADADHVKSVSFVFASVSLGSGALMFITVTVCVYRKRWYIQFYWHKIKKLQGRRRNNTDTATASSLLYNKQVRYDAFVLYHESDAHFVRQCLCHLLEVRLGYRLLIWDREGDFGSRAESYFNAIDSSRIVIIVMSDDMMQDPWCYFQAEVAEMDKRGATAIKNKVFVVLRQNVDLNIANKFWCMLLTKNVCGKWCDNQNSIRKKVFVEDVQNVLGKPMHPRSMV